MRAFSRFWAAWMVASMLALWATVRTPSLVTGGAALALALAGWWAWKERQTTRQLLRDLRARVSQVVGPLGSWQGTPAKNASVGNLPLETEVRDLISEWEELCCRCKGTHEKEMQEAERLAAVGEMAAGLAHEIRNPLAGIAGAIEVFSHSLPEDFSDREILGELQGEVQRIEKVLTDLLAYAKPRPPDFVELDLNQTVLRALKLAEQQASGKKIQIEARLEPRPVIVRHDPEHIYQVLLNLLLNALQAVGQEGEIRVATRLQTPEPNGGRPLVEITVEDTGEGIREEHLSKIFDPFFTTKRRGTGLGLSLCRRIVLQHGGNLTAQSELGRGSRFTLTLATTASKEALQQIRV